ncbi:MAG: hypothetical protein K2W82_17410 [Candidatus Obscuribacterales bacterium]|nr:hypothetical protein [Candidatus Obscuribacterales bacterium]
MKSRETIIRELRNDSRVRKYVAECLALSRRSANRQGEWHPPMCDWEVGVAAAERLQARGFNLLASGGKDGLWEDLSHLTLMRIPRRFDWLRNLFVWVGPTLRWIGSAGSRSSKRCCG